EDSKKEEVQVKKARTLEWVVDRVGTRKLPPPERAHSSTSQVPKVDRTTYNLASSYYLANRIEIKNPPYSASKLPIIHNRQLFIRVRDNPREFVCRGRAIWKLAITDILFHAFPSFPPGCITKLNDKIKIEMFDKLWKSNKHGVGFLQYLAIYYLDQKTDGMEKVIYFVKCLLQPLTGHFLQALNLLDIDARDEKLAPAAAPHG
ncbi:11610_t:CDS:1, partial [Ambispora leptoticha]